MHKRLILSTIPKLVKKNNFLPVNHYASKHFAGTDDKRLYKTNLNIMPDDWYYRHNTVTYTLNKDGYRAPEFKTVDWANSAVIFGCSHAFGVGVDDKDTVAEQLSKLIGKPVINMGVGGTAILYSFHNSSILRDGYPTPLAVVQLWSAHSRAVYYKSRSIISCGAWNAEEDNYMQYWAEDDTHSQIHSVFASKISKHLWQDTKYFEGSFFSDTAELLDCAYLEHVDCARDLRHYGPKTHALVAQQIADNLNV